MEKETLLLTAVEYFAQYPTEQTLYITPDNMVFLEAHAHEAKGHANEKFQGELFQFTRAEVEAAVKEAETENTQTPDETWEVKNILSWLKKAGKPMTKDASKEELLAAVAEITKPV